MRSGSVVTILGAYVGFRAATVQIARTQGILSVNTGLPYGWISLFLVIVGGLVWGYGDCVL